MGAMIDRTVQLTDTLVCEKHGEYQAKSYELLGRVVRATACSACMEEAEAARKAEEAGRHSERVRLIWEAKIGSAGIPERFRDRTLESYRAGSDGQRRALAFADRYAQHFSETPGKSALFLGKPGTGKTHLAIGIALRLIQAGNTAMFCTVMRAIRMVKETWRRNSEMSEDCAIKALTFPDLLILDEVGVQFGSDAEKLILFDVLNERYEQRRSTLLMSNLTAPEVSTYLGERVMDRLREDGGEVIVFDWESFRGQT